MNTIREIQKINDQELELGLAGTPASWHAQYSKSAWVYLGNLDYSLTEGDVICVLSQFGEIEDLHLVRDDETGKSKGFAFCKYEDARSCVLAVDNFCGIQLCSRSLRVDHVENYRLPKNLQKKDDDDDGGGEADSAKEEKKQQQQQQDNNDVDVTLPGHAYRGQELASKYNISQGQDLFAKPSEEKEVSGDHVVKVDRDDDDDSQKRRRKEERRYLREVKAERKRERDKKRSEREEKRRTKKKAKKSGKRSHKDKKKEQQDSSASRESSDSGEEDL